MPKTNNAIEGWHNSFEHQQSACHPSTWKFIERLKQEQRLNEVKIEQYVGGVQKLWGGGGRKN